MARLAASAMRFMRSLPMNARLFFLTLLANNLPESGKRQYQNKGTCAPTRRDAVNRRAARKEKICAAIFSAKRNASPVSGAAQHRNPTQAA
jgi:hypothetical protein